MKFIDALRAAEEWKNTLTPEWRDFEEAEVATEKAAMLAALDKFKADRQEPTP